MYSASQVEEMLCKAVMAAYCGEQQLFKERAHERSIVFHIARHLAAYVNERLPGWSVDVEYDRRHRCDLEGVKKRMLAATLESAVAVTGSQPNQEGAADSYNDVYPDIIVHNRSGLSADHDLLVVEVKKEETPGHERDRAKLHGFRGGPFHYQHAAFVVLPTNGARPHCEWII
jgi:hypothetical protein